nr:uncharacterized protein LOC109169433 [Ipomoea trifida]
MHTRSKGVRGLQPLDLEIERGVKQRRRERRAILQQQKVAMESTSQGVTHDTPEQEGEHHVLNPQNDPRRAPVQNDYQQVSIEEHDHISPQVASLRHQGMLQQGYQPPRGEPPLGNAPQRNPPHAPPPYHHPYPPRLPYHYGYYYPLGPPPQPQVPHDQMPPPRDSTTGSDYPSGSYSCVSVYFYTTASTTLSYLYASSTCCEICGGGYASVDCYILETRSQGSHGAMVEHVDHVDYGRSSGPYQRNFQHQVNAHPGFPWGNPLGAANPIGVASWVSSSQGHQGGPSQFGYHGNQSHSPRPAIEAPKGRSLEDLFQAIQKLNVKVDQVAAHNKMLENQIANQASPSSNNNDGIRDMGDDTLSKSMNHKKKKLKVMGFGKIASSIGGKPPNEDKNVLL